MASSRWQPDILGPDFSALTIDLGADPDGEGQVSATLVRHEQQSAVTAAVLYVHGFTDYFFQRPLAEFFAQRGFAFYALDLRKCGRSQRPGQTPHHITDLAMYDVELTLAAQEINAASGNRPLLIAAHSTGGLITALWLDRLRRGLGRLRRGPDRTHRDPAVGTPSPTGLVLNSPWFDLQGAPILRGAGTTVVNAVARVRPLSTIPRKIAGAYGESLHNSVHGEWEYDLDYKPLHGYPVTFGFLSGVRRGHASLHRGLDIGVPSLVLHSDATTLSGPGSDGPGPHIDSADGVLDTRQIARWSGCLGNRVSVVPVPGARHDVFLSRLEARDTAYTELDNWLLSNNDRIRGALHE
ncbi:alpha/beta hydrolase [Williamsia limnetica]|uniref:alpha/beta hydrolase n=1 Tax=Williamsia limnetica TaxID=882452 RepID=UPI001FE7068A|nr:alpha/beta hydrolase [Williamsia limnetica]